MPQEKGKVKASKRNEPPDKNHWQHFNEALQKALDDADGQWGPGQTDARVELQAEVHTASPGNIHEYSVILTPIT
jgi:hypothetical protein